MVKMVSNEEIKRRLEEKRGGVSRSKSVEDRVHRTKNITPDVAPGNLMRCTNCNLEFSEDAMFCTECGNKLVEDKEELLEESKIIPPEKATSSSPPQSTLNTPSITIPSNAEFKDETMADILIVNADYVTGYKAVKTLGFVYGLTVISKISGGDDNSDMHSISEDEIREFVKIMEESRKEALKSMLEYAQGLGANAIINTRFDSDDISEQMKEILAYGTAVIIEKE